MTKIGVFLEPVPSLFGTEGPVLVPSPGTVPNLLSLCGFAFCVFLRSGFGCFLIFAVYAVHAACEVICVLWGFITKNAQG